MIYFSIHELSRSYTAMAKKIPNEPPAQAKDALMALTDNVLDPLRKAFGRPIYVSSGYRSPALNRAVGGASNSQHIHGEAADITSGSRTLNRKLFDLLISLDLPFDQLIDEYGYKWIHVSHSPRNRKSILHIN